ncbi:MAG: aspartate carbamoyltransferase [Chloroflexota bacterium]
MLTGRSIVTINDLANREIEGVFSLADEMSNTMKEQYGLLRGKILATLFFEPSTRTRLSFEAAMHRLGGDVISVAEAKSTSIAKGETIADTAKIVGSYADIIVIRHPWEGAAKVVADYAGVPVINAGDGSHEHPTQTLCDLYTIKKERGNIRGLKIALWGDLKNGRTVHSLIYALARFGAIILFRPGPGLEVPEHVIRKLTAEFGGEFKRYETLTESVKSKKLPVDAMYITPDNPHQLAMMPDVRLDLELKRGIDALYVTRLQMERLAQEEGTLRETYPVVNKKLLSEKEFQKALVMHPLPRVDELAYELDADPRSMYFKQAARGIPIRMALLSLLLGAKELPPAREEEPAPKVSYPLYRREYGIRCANPRCISIQPSEREYITPDFQIISSQPLTLRCSYCEHETNPLYIASTDWHEGRVEEKKYHAADSQWTQRIKPENLILFDSKKEAEAHGFRASRFTGAPKRRQMKKKETPKSESSD